MRSSTLANNRRIIPLSPRERAGVRENHSIENVMRFMGRAYYNSGASGAAIANLIFDFLSLLVLVARTRSEA